MTKEYSFMGSPHLLSPASRPEHVAGLRQAFLIGQLAIPQNTFPSHRQAVSGSRSAAGSIPRFRARPSFWFDAVEHL
jgi:hypothetical protein